MCLSCVRKPRMSPMLRQCRVREEKEGCVAWTTTAILKEACFFEFLCKYILIYLHIYIKEHEFSTVRLDLSTLANWS